MVDSLSTGSVSTIAQIDRPNFDRMQTGSRPAFGGIGRLCSRTGCSERAEVTLTYHYGQSRVWLDELIAEREPHAYDMCLHHAARLSVPHGWYIDDRRGGHPTLIAV